MGQHVLSCETVVVGGGIAASCTALQLARHGREVTVLVPAPAATDDFPRTLPVPALAVLGGLGLTEAYLGECIVGRARAMVAWASAGFVAAPQESYVVALVRLADMLRRRAEVLGVRYVSCSEGLTLSRKLAGWVLDAGHAQLDARFLIVADARSAPGERQLEGAPLHALLASWQGSARDSSRIHVEATADGWCWLMELPSGARHLLAMHDPADGEPLSELLARLRARAVLLRQLLPPGQPRLSLVDASSYSRAPAMGNDFALVGSACSTLDPLSSQGLVAAVVGALQVAAATNTILSHPEDAGLARSFYVERVAEQRAAHVRATAAFYAEAAERFDSAFWSRRRHPSQVAMEHPRRACAGTSPLVLSPTASIVELPALVRERVLARPALVHPSLSRPLAFLDGTPIQELLDDVMGGRAPGAVVDWFWQRGIVEHPPHLAP